MNEVNNNGIPNGNTPVNPGAMSFNVPPTEGSVPQQAPNVVTEPVTNNVNQASPVAPANNMSMQSALANSTPNATPVNVPPTPNVEAQQPASGNSNVSLGTVVNSGITMSEPINEIPAGGNNNNVTLGANPLPTEETTNANIPDEPVKEKKKTSPIVIIALVLVLLVGAAAAYYFLLETPKSIFSRAYDGLLSQIKENQNLNNSYISYDLKLNINSENEEYKQYSEIINNIGINGTTGYNDTTKSLTSNNMITYKSSELVNLSLLVNDKTTYLKLNNILDKVLKLDLDEPGESVVPSVDTNFNDYLDIQNTTLLQKY